MREEDLIKQLVGLIDIVELHEDGIIKQYKEEVKRYSAFQNRVQKIDGQQQEQKNINVRNYIKYLLKEGTMQERREILSCIKNKIIIKNKILSIEK